MLTRRRFLTASSLAMTGDLLTPSLQGLWAASSRPSVRRIALPPRAAAPVTHFLEPIAEPAAMHALAATALDAARQAGADWADVRLGAGRAYQPGGYSSAYLTYSFGVRVRIGGVEAFVGGGTPTPDRLTQAARAAVATAKGLAAGATSLVGNGLTPVPAATGEWVTPMEMDPFEVSVDEHTHVHESLNGAADVRLAQAGVQRVWSVTFQAETRVQASTDGTRITQRLNNAVVIQNFLRRQPWRLRGPGEQLAVPFSGYGSCTGGFEVVARLNRFDAFEQAAHELRQYESLPGRLVDVGRYNVVFDGVAHATILQRVLVFSLSLQRVLWGDADLGGTSPLRPVSDVLGQQRFSPLLSLNVVSTPPAYGASRWDAEGVEATGGPLIANGTVVNYITSRATHARLTKLLASASGPSSVPPLLGCTSATHASDQPTELPASVSMPAASNGGTLAELAKQLGSGIVARGGEAAVNPDGTGGILYPLMMFEVQGGQLVRRVFGASLQFSTKKLFTSLKALGNAGTIGEATTLRFVGFPENRIDTSLTSPAALYNGVDIITHQ